MAYVIINEHGALASKPGMPNSYTRSLREAIKYPTYEAAKTNCCHQNEFPFRFEALLNAIRR